VLLWLPLGGQMNVKCK